MANTLKWLADKKDSLQALAALLSSLAIVCTAIATLTIGGWMLFSFAVAKAAQQNQQNQQNQQTPQKANP